MQRAWLIVGALLASSAQAAVPSLCSDAPNQVEGSQCASRKLRDAEAGMERAYAELRRKLDPIGRRNLGLAQAAWQTFRGLECDLETGNDASRPGSGGTIMPMLLDECATALTGHRARDLTEQSKCPGGDLSCER